MDCILSILMLCKIDNIHYERVTDCTDSTLHGYNIMSIVCTLYGYQDSALNHMVKTDECVSERRLARTENLTA